MSSAVSFEVFPPRTPAAESQLFAALERLAPLNPRFVSVTCGAGGSTRGPTLETLRAIVERTSLNVAGHLTCSGCPREEIDGAIGDYWAAGVRHIVALRGDMPEPGSPFVPHPDGYDGSVALIEAIRRSAPFEISVSAYPEIHPESRSLQADLDLLARKVDAGATQAITQFCFVTEAIVKLRDSVARAGIEIPIVPGIMQVTNFSGVARFAERCGASVPDWVARRFEGLEEDLEGRRLAAAVLAAGQVEALQREGFETFHFYTLNQADVIAAICPIVDERHRSAEVPTA